MQKAKVKADIKKNRLYFTIEGRLTKKELESLYTDVRFCVADLKPGFDVITDLTGCTLATIGALPTFVKISSYLICSQVGYVVRVIDDSNIIFKETLNFAEKFQGYQTINASSMEEAETTLDNVARRDGVRLNLRRQAVSYNSETMSGKGKVLDISISGCAIQKATVLPAPEDELTMIIEFPLEGEDCSSFTIPCRVVRVEERGFAVQYLAMEDEQREQLWQCMIRETKKLADL